jgi:hypothetical protein
MNVHNARLERLARGKQSDLLVQFVSWDEKEVFVNSVADLLIVEVATICLADWYITTLYEWVVGEQRVGVRIG